jgi:O-antigen/teichoic acid export membrane protein
MVASSPGGETLTPRGTYWLLGRSAGAKLLVLPVTAAFSLVTTRIIVTSTGAEGYAQYGLLVSLTALLPFLDLGLGAAVTNAVAGSANPKADLRVRATLVTAIRALLISSVILLVFTLLATATGLWPRLLGAGLIGPSGSNAAGVSLALLAVTVPMALGQRILNGLQRNHIQIVLVALQAPITCLLVGLSATVSIGTWAPPVAFYVSLLLSTGLTAIAARKLSSPMLTGIARDVFARRSPHGPRPTGTAVPMLIVMIGLPLALQSDRLVLSHAATSADLAQYTAVAQLFIPVWALISVTGIALWPVYARSRGRRLDPGHSPARLSLVFAGATAGICFLIGLLTQWLVALMTRGEVVVQVGTIVAFGCLMVAQAAQYPMGMFLTDPAGLRFQALTVAALLPLNLALSVALAMKLGAQGPVWASAVTVLTCQVLPNVGRVTRVTRRAGIIP